jgi:hypothetical protein
MVCLKYLTTNCTSLSLFWFSVNYVTYVLPNKIENHFVKSIESSCFPIPIGFALQLSVKQEHLMMLNFMLGIVCLFCKGHSCLLWKIVQVAKQNGSSSPNDHCWQTDSLVHSCLSPDCPFMALVVALWLRYLFPALLYHHLWSLERVSMLKTTSGPDPLEGAGSGKVSRQGRAPWQRCISLPWSCHPLGTGGFYEDTARAGWKDGGFEEALGWCASAANPSAIYIHTMLPVRL